MSVSADARSFDFNNPVDLEHTVRIGTAWIELRRGAGSTRLRDYFFGRDEPLEQGQMDALDLLVRRDRTMKGLAGRLRIEPSTATRAVQRIVNDGLAERYTSPDDGRVVMVKVTAEGRRRHAAVAERRAAALERIIGSFTPDERAQLADLLERLNNAVTDVVDELDTSHHPRDDTGGGTDPDTDRDTDTDTDRDTDRDTDLDTGSDTGPPST